MSSPSPLRSLGRRVSRGAWRLSGLAGRQIDAHVDAQATVLVTYYHRARLRYLNDQVRNLLRCRFVERLILSNHNPELRLTDVLAVRDPRLAVLQQKEHRGCGYRWVVANQHMADYMIVVDDDLLLYPGQLACVFDHLVRDPTRPHGLAGMTYSSDGAMQYVQGADRTVDYLCELYAVTRAQLARYHELRGRLNANPAVTTAIDNAADFVLIGRSGVQRPRIHPVGRVFRAESFNEDGVAVHQGERFGSSVDLVRTALEATA